MSVPPDQMDLWALAPHVVKPLNQQAFLVIRRDNGAVAALDMQWQRFLQMLQRFNTLAGHAQAIAAAVPALKGQQSALQSGLAPLVKTGVFVSASELAGQLTEAAAAPAEKMPLTIVIPTCDRPRLLGRLLDSLRSNQETFGTGWPVEVIDDSRDEANRRRNAELVGEAVSHFPATYVGRQEQQALIDHLCAEFPEGEEYFRWLLWSEHPAHEGQATYGVPINHAVLRHAGRRVIFIDDDAVIRAWTKGNGRAGIRFDNQIRSFDVCLDIDKVSRSLGDYPEDPLFAHASVLGTKVAEALAELRAGAASPFGATSSAELAFLDPQYSLVRYSVNGILGDTGAENDLTSLQSLSPRILRDEALYKRFRESARCIFSGQPFADLLSSVWFQRTTAAGVNLDPYMAPVMPTGRGEDTMMGVLMRYLYPGDFGMRFEFALEHRPAGKRPWVFDACSRGRRITGAGALALWLWNVSAPPEMAPADKMLMAGESVQEMLKAGHTESFLRGAFAAHWHGVLAGDLAGATELLARNPQGCPSWRDDMEAMKREMLAELQKPTAMPEPVVASALSMVDAYTRGLPIWNIAFEFCRRAGDGAA